MPPEEKKEPLTHLHIAFGIFETYRVMSTVGFTMGVKARREGLQKILGDSHPLTVLGISWSEAMFPFVYRAVLAPYDISRQFFLPYLPPENPSKVD